ncbi:Os01g0718150 [Oryza sativa Japonica Group]|uniref:Os01g0718150 protein n=1 Tax=Oryza sativa subsp. japonica TaxID=39947 RepID=A0A0N7KDM7_ORYSJ|nr:Os01g0718150 [Oryza sativa Japonica Group]
MVKSRNDMLSPGLPNSNVVVGVSSPQASPNARGVRLAIATTLPGSTTTGHRYACPCAERCSPSDSDHFGHSVLYLYPGMMNS